MGNEIETSLTEQLAALGVTYAAHYCGESVRDNDWKCDAWRVTFSRGGTSMSTDYFTGLGHRAIPKNVRQPYYVKSSRDFARWTKEESKPVTPHAAGVLHSLTMDASATNESFNDWCSNYGFDSDSFKAFNMYQACCAISKQLAQVFTHAEKTALAELLQDY